MIVSLATATLRRGRLLKIELSHSRIKRHQFGIRKFGDQWFALASKNEVKTIPKNQNSLNMLKYFRFVHR